MSRRKPRFEVVRSDAGWHARFVGANGRKVWQTEVYRKRIDAVRAVELIVGNLVRTSPFAEHPEIGWQGEPDYPTEVRTVDERSKP